MKALIIAAIATLSLSSPAFAKCVNILGDSCDGGLKTEQPAPAPKEGRGEPKAEPKAGALDTVDGVIETLDRIDQQSQQLKRLFDR